jgi:hypothetical protein
MILMKLTRDQYIIVGLILVFGISYICYMFMSVWAIAGGYFIYVLQNQSATTQELLSHGITEDRVLFYFNIVSMLMVACTTFVIAVVMFYGVLVITKMGEQWK